MKNELSILLTWLKDIKKCQIIQTCWYISTNSWELHNKDLIEEIMISTKNLFYERYRYNILENEISLEQFLIDGEINLVGLELNSGTIANIYGINSVDCLKMRYSSVTTETIIIDMLKTAMLFYGYYSLSKGTIIFADTELDSSKSEQLNDAIKLLNEVFKIFGFHFSFMLYANEEYNMKVHEIIESQEKPRRKTRPMKVRESIIESQISTGIVEYLQQSGYEVIDQREKGGALWIIGGEELEPFLEKLSENIKFHFTIKGSKSTKNKPAWYTKSKN